MNMVPNDMGCYRRSLDCIEKEDFDFFQPLENLRCQSLCNFFLKDPDTIQKEIERIQEGQEPALSLIERICSGNIECRESLV